MVNLVFKSKNGDLVDCVHTDLGYADSFDKKKLTCTFELHDGTIIKSEWHKSGDNFAKDRYNFDCKVLAEHGYKIVEFK